MMKLKSISKEVLLKKEEKYMLPLMVLAWLPPLFVVRDGLTGLFLGIATVFLFLLLEGSALWLKKYLNPVLQMVSYLAMLIALSGIMGIALQLLLFARTNVLFFERANILIASCMLEQVTSVYILRKLVKVHKKEETAKTNEGKEIIDRLLACFEAAVEYLLFLVIVGLLREYIGKLFVTARLLSGGFLLTAALLFLWKLTKTMPEQLRKLPRFALNAGLILLVLTGFIGLF